MKGKVDTISEIGFQFFGKITASISHEIKNVLAIINENAGLLEDFMLMADRGMPIDPQRLKTLSGSVMAQIRRANTIVKNLNRFAHSTDESLKSVDINDTLDLMVALFQRLAAMRRVTLDLKLPEVPLKITTHPFLLMSLIGCCLDFAMAAAGEDKIILISAQKSGSGVQIRFSQLARIETASLDDFPAQREKRLLDLLGAELIVKATAQELVIALAEDADGGHQP